MTRCAGAGGAGRAAGAPRGVERLAGRLKAAVDFGQIDELIRAASIDAFLERHHAADAKHIHEARLCGLSTSP